MSETQVITGKVRFSYAHVFVPSSMKEDQEKKYRVALLIPKDDTATVAKIKKAIRAALEKGKSKFDGKIPNNWKDPLRDGDAEREDNEEYENTFFINASSTRKPTIVDENLDEIIVREEFYSGCYGRASVNFYAFNVSGNKGIACGLNHLQKLQDGTPLGGVSSSAAEDFGDEDDLL